MGNEKKNLGIKDRQCLSLGNVEFLGNEIFNFNNEFAWKTINSDIKLNRGRGRERKSLFTFHGFEYNSTIRYAIL